MTQINDFKIVDNVLLEYLGEGGDVIIPNGVTEIGDCVFDECKIITSISLPEGIKRIGHHAFDNCKNLKKINVPRTVKIIGYRAFCGCEGLADNDGFVIVKNTLYSYYGNAEVVIIPAYVKEICGAVFENNKKIVCVEVPDGVKKINWHTFVGCNNLISVKLPQRLTQIGEYAFAYCENLKEINISESINKIGRDAFTGCKRLADKNGFLIINNVLYGYYGDDTNVIIPPFVTKIDCFGKRKENLISITIPESVTKIGAYTFEFCKNLKSAFMSDNAITFGEEAFGSCPNLTIYAPKGSHAERYAKRNQISFTAT